jgi:hypothetical protein
MKSFLKYSFSIRTCIMKTSIKTIGLQAALAMGRISPLFSQLPDLAKDHPPLRITTSASKR